MTIAAVLVSLAGALFSVSQVQGVEIATPLLRKQAGNDFRCLVYNAGPKPIEVAIRIWDPVFFSGGSVNRTIGPERAVEVTSEFPRLANCRVEGKFSKKKTLVTLCVAPPTTAECSVAVTAP